MSAAETFGSPANPAPARLRVVRRALALEWFTIGWNVVEAVVAIVSGWLAGSIALVGFGLDSVIESLSGCVLLDRLGWERRAIAEGGRADPGAVERREKRALRIVGATFFVLSAYVGFESIRKLRYGDAPEVSVAGLILLALSLAVMPALAVAKIRASRQLSSAALRADAGQTLVCSLLSAITLSGIGLNAIFGWWWADPAAALAVIPWLLREGSRAWRGEGCCP